ncbi:uncharacterized protein LOC144712965 isoform X2 [Wolffia australiana]
MVYSYTPAYYSSVHETITGLCKNILPSFKSRRLISQSERKLAKRQSDNIKWQQESFHRILNLIGLHKAGITTADELSSARSRLLQTLISSSNDDEQEPPAITRDKLLFLQELLYADCISADEYHATKQPLLRKLAAQGAEVDCRDVIVRPRDPTAEEWSEIDLRDKETAPEKPQSKPKLLLPSIKRAVSFVKTSATKAKESRSIKRWKRSDDESATPYLPPGERSDERPDTKRMKKKLHPDGAPSDFFIDKVLGENIKKELSRIQSELHATNPNLAFSDDQIEAISTRLPVEKADLERFFPKTWCDRYGGVVLDVVKKEFKDHVASNLFDEKPRSCFAYNPFIDEDDVEFRR